MQLHLKMGLEEEEEEEEEEEQEEEEEEKEEEDEVDNVFSHSLNTSIHTDLTLIMQQGRSERRMKGEE